MELRFQNVLLFCAAHLQHLTQISEFNAKLLMLIRHPRNLLIDDLVFLCHFITFLRCPHVLSFRILELRLMSSITRLVRSPINFYWS